MNIKLYYCCLILAVLLCKLLLSFFVFLCKCLCLPRSLYSRHILLCNSINGGCWWVFCERSSRQKYKGSSPRHFIDTWKHPGTFSPSPHRWIIHKTLLFISTEIWPIEAREIMTLRPVNGGLVLGGCSFPAAAIVVTTSHLYIRCLRLIFSQLRSCLALIKYRCT